MKLPWHKPNVSLVLQVEATPQYVRFFNLYQYVWPKYVPIDHTKIPNYFSYWVPQIWNLIEEVCSESPYDVEDFIETYHARYGY